MTDDLFYIPKRIVCTVPEKIAQKIKAILLNFRSKILCKVILFVLILMIQRLHYIIFICI